MIEVRRFSGFDQDEPAIVLDRIGPGTFRLREPFRYQDPDFGTIIVPADVETFETDLSSSPWFSQWYTPILGDHTPAVLLHDALIGDADRPTYRASGGRPIGDDDADRIFADALRVTGTPLVRRLIMWSAASLATAMRRSRARRWMWVVALVVVAAVHALDIVDVVNWLPWLGTRPFFLEWAISVASVSATMMAVGLIVFPARYAKTIAVQAMTGGLTFLPVLVMLPPWLALVWLPERIARRGL